MKYKIVIFQNNLNQSLYVPKKKYPFFPFWLTFTTDIDSSGTVGCAQFDSYNAARDFIKHERDSKWYCLNNDIEINP